MSNQDKYEARLIRIERDIKVLVSLLSKNIPVLSRAIEEFDLQKEIEAKRETIIQSASRYIDKSDRKDMSGPNTKNDHSSR